MSSLVAGRVLAERLPPDEVIFGVTPAMGAIRHKLEKAADTNIPVVIQGESGTGKEVIAEYIHQRSIWANGPFAKINCPAIPETLVESELFGYERGAFTGAVGSKPGRVELAQRGTLFLDEISELAIGLQAKLLQLLQDGHFCPVGGAEDKRVDVRIICATNRQLSREVEEGRFRQDLYYRINVMSVHLPPLRERVGDIATLVDYFLELQGRRYHCSARPLSSRTMALLCGHSWPGNIRELENVVKRYVVLGTEDAITSELNGHGDGMLEADFAPDSMVSLKAATQQATKDLERKMILNALEANQWSRKRAARALKISYRALLYKIKVTGLRRGDSIQPSLDDE